MTTLTAAGGGAAGAGRGEPGGGVPALAADQVRGRPRHPGLLLRRPQPPPPLPRLHRHHAHQRGAQLRRGPRRGARRALGPGGVAPHLRPGRAARRVGGGHALHLRGSDCPGSRRAATARL